MTKNRGPAGAAQIPPTAVAPGGAGAGSPLSRRGALVLALGAGVLTACGKAPVAPVGAPGLVASTHPLVAAPAPPPAPPAGPRPAVMIDHAADPAPRVALTFHGSGPVPITRQIMSILTTHSAQATVFAVGTWLAASPEVARIVLDAGNEFGNHTWSHPELSREKPAQVYQQIVRCRDELIKLTGSPGAFFRQSDGQYPTHDELVQAGRAGYRHILAYDVDSTDWLGAGTAGIRRAVAKAKPGSIISLHLGRPNTVEALPLVLADLRARGLAAVTASRLLGGAPARTAAQPGH